MYNPFQINTARRGAKWTHLVWPCVFAASYGQLITRFIAIPFFGVNIHTCKRVRRCIHSIGPDQFRVFLRKKSFNAFGSHFRLTYRLANSYYLFWYFYRAIVTRWRSLFRFHICIVMWFSRIFLTFYLQRYRWKRLTNIIA